MTRICRLKSAPEFSDLAGLAFVRLVVQSGSLTIHVLRSVSDP